MGWVTEWGVIGPNEIWNLLKPSIFLEHVLFLISKNRQDSLRLLGFFCRHYLPMDSIREFHSPDRMEGQKPTAQLQGLAKRGRWTTNRVDAMICWQSQGSETYSLFIWTAHIWQNETKKPHIFSCTFQSKRTFKILLKLGILSSNSALKILCLEVLKMQIVLQFVTTEWFAFILKHKKFSFSPDMFAYLTGWQFWL